MKRILWIAVLVALALTVSSEFASAQADLRMGNLAAASKRDTKNQDDPVALGHPLSYWLKSIRDRDPEKIQMAFDAIVELGPEAWRAVPELTKIVAEPFAPIEFESDSRSQIHRKLLDIQLRAGAVDSLGAIGEAAASSAGPVIRWGMTIRVLPGHTRSSADPFLIELIGIDVLERMRVAGTVARFGRDASGAVQKLIESPDNEARKFSAAILNEATVLIATGLMTSRSCVDRELGLSLLSAMWPVVAKDHLITLGEILECSEYFGRNLPSEGRK
jgi:hypothetical protein